MMLNRDNWVMFHIHKNPKKNFEQKKRIISFVVKREVTYLRSYDISYIKLHNYNWHDVIFIAVY